ncbi:PF04304 family protein [Leptospira broomii serovar Hurstbridge str. 5399]|uniref:PF04304 family protein n=1 Tax=Leptospira broomii serovar Hurstbridge str. 5399 TaxID=1049789 RepID=T0FEW2_9LEPT|nr:YbaN family protein [Leptospira broomii]EQA46122.1 PF04304 family protein [Leptospira broomii serovar Hurstbridge str. 5399]
MQKEYKDYSHEVQPHKSKLIRTLLIIFGTVCVALGILGIFVPGLPTTPFLLLAAACYAKASERFYNWLMNNRYFGSFIRDWRIHKAIPLRAKIIAVSTIILTMGLSAIFLPVIAVRIGMGVIGLIVIAYLLRFPTKKKETLN